MGSSLKEKLFSDVLPHVAKPNRYIGNEINMTVKDPAAVDCTWVLAFPDVYEIGMSHTGFKILYHVLNLLPRVAAERAYSPWTDAEELMRKAGVAAYGLESFRPLSAYDIVGITLQSELNFTNCLNLLDLGGIPVRTVNRKPGDPVVIAGGPNTVNPLPMAPFFDCMVVGDGEEVVQEISRTYMAGKKENLDRDGIIGRLATIQGVYVPGVSRQPVSARKVAELKSEYYPAKDLIPLSRITHDRLAVEIMRGCLNGCRFCQAGMIDRPLRERTVPEITAAATRACRDNGWEEVSLLSLSTTDHSGFDRLMEELASETTAVSVPSQRVDVFLKRASSIPGIKKGGLTFAPEAGSERLRRSINKDIRDDDIIAAAELARKNGYRLIKLYFMVGLPGETDEDLDAVVQLVERIRATGFTKGGTLKISLSPFVPKPFTPFQWERQGADDEVYAKVSALKKRLDFRHVECSYRDTKLSVVEGVLARGDAGTADAVYAAWQNGCRFDGWTDCFDYNGWRKAFQTTGLDVATALAARDPVTPLPWEPLVETGVSREFLLKERQLAAEGTPTPGCAGSTCTGCGVCEGPLRNRIGTPGSAASPAPQETGTSRSFGRTKRKDTQNIQKLSTGKRLHYTKGEEVKFISHLDIMQLFQRCVKMARIPVAWSQGFHPHPKMAFGPPLSVGYTSGAEYLDIILEGAFRMPVGTALNRILPPGIRIADEKELLGKPASLSAAINLAEYEITVRDGNHAEILGELAAAVEKAGVMDLEKVKKDSVKRIDLKKHIYTIGFETRNGKEALVMQLTCDQQKGAVRPDDLFSWYFGDRPVPPFSVHRSALYVSKADGTMYTPLEVF